MLIVLVIFIILPSIFTFAVSHISANKLQYLRFQIKQVRKNLIELFRVDKKKKRSVDNVTKRKPCDYRQRTKVCLREKKKRKVCIHVRPSLKHHITS
jgi:hypothetical protein